MMVPGWMPCLGLSWLRTALNCSCWLQLSLSLRSCFLDKIKYRITSGPHLKQVQEGFGVVFFLNWGAFQHYTVKVELQTSHEVDHVLTGTAEHFYIFTS